MKENQWLFVRSFSRYSRKHTSNANMAAETRHLPKSDGFIHGRQCSSPFAQRIYLSLFFFFFSFLISVYWPPQGYRRSLFHVLSNFVQLVRFAVECRALHPPIPKRAHLVLKRRVTHQSSHLRPHQGVNPSSIARCHKQNIWVSSMTIMAGWTVRIIFTDGKA